MTINKPKRGSARFQMCARLLVSGVEFQPMKTEDTGGDEEGREQIIWCFISKGRTDGKRPAVKIYVQHTPSPPLRYFIPFKLAMI